MNKKNYITYFIAKTALFTILAILVLVFREKFVEYLPVFIGALMVLYGVEGIKDKEMPEIGNIKVFASEAIKFA